MITVENADKALKDYYLDAISAQLNDNISPFYNAIEKNTNNVFGKDVKISIVRDGSGSITACAEDSDLPAPHKNRYIDITVPLKNLYGTIEISDKALRASRDKSGAFVNLLNAEMEGLVNCAKRNFSRMLFGDGTAYLCSVQSCTEGNTYTVDDVSRLEVGMCIDIYPTKPSIMYDSFGVYIINIDTAKKTITLNREVVDFIENGEVYPHDGKDGELTGLDAIFNGDTLYGHSKADKYFSPFIVDTGSEITEDKMCEVIDGLEENFNSTVNMIICSYGMRKKIAALVSDNRRVVNSIDVHTGIGAVTVNGIPVYADKYCPDNCIYFLNTNDFCLHQLCDWEWLEDEGGKILKQVPGKAAYGATLVKYAELVCKKPCGQGMLRLRR